MPGARTVTAGPAMRTSGCIARIIGSMKPQFRKWPIVAGSARTSVSKRLLSRPGGSGLRVNIAKLLHVRERAVTQAADIAARVDHVIAALKHLAPSHPGVRHGAHGLAAALDALLGAGDQPRHLRMLEVAELADRAGKVVRADEQHVNAVDRGDRVDVVDRLRRFDLADDHELAGRSLAVLGGLNAVVRGARRPERRAAPAVGRIA